MRAVYIDTEFTQLNKVMGSDTEVSPQIYPTGNGVRHDKLNIRV
jgi:hypothetical protein